MLLPKFDFHEPKSIEYACRMMAELGPEAKLIAGGTDLLLNMKRGLIAPKQLIWLSQIDDLRGIDSANGLLKIGSCCSVSEIIDSEVIRTQFSALYNSAMKFGSPLTRNLATIGGNFASARPAASLPPSVMAYGGKVVLKNSTRERVVPAEDLFKGQGQTIIEPDEILTEIQIGKPPANSGAAYIKLGLREALEIALVNAVCFICLDGPGGPIKEARIALGSVAPTPIRAPSAEKMLVGQKPSESLFAEAGKAAVKDISPVDDFRASATYKKAMVEVLTKRAIEQACYECE